MEEIWKDVQGYEGKYQISNLGNVKSIKYRGLDYERLLVPKKNNCGRLWVDLWKNGSSKQYLVHRLVAIAFIPNPENLPQINHIDENVENNMVENLEWCTGMYNVHYYLERHGNVSKRRKPSPKRRRQLDRSIYQMDKCGNIIKEWQDARTLTIELGYNQWSITQCCDGKRKTAYGFKWQYAI